MSLINVSEKDIHKISQNIEKPVALVGMMGAGKSHIGALLAKALGFQVVDIDKVIEQKAGLSIPEIFEKFGEEKFRDVEAKTIGESLDQRACVLSTGGGALAYEKSLQALKDESLMIWLDADSDILWSRIQDSDRPLLQTENPRGTLEALIEDREPLYQQAHIHVKVCDNASDTLNRVLKALLHYLNLDNE